MSTVVGVEIDILYVPDCPNRAAARSRVAAALDDAGVTAEVREVEVATVADAARLGMHGSPTILVDGRDPFDGPEASMSCRLYRSVDGLAGTPTVEQLVAVLR